MIKPKYLCSHYLSFQSVIQTILQLSGFCPGKPGWAGTRRNIHPLTPIVVVSHPLSASFIYYDPWHPPCSIYVLDSLFAQSLSKFSFVYLLAWQIPLHTPDISSPNHCLLFTAHAHTIRTCFAVVPRLCHLILVSLSILYLEFHLGIKLQDIETYMNVKLWMSDIQFWNQSCISQIHCWCGPVWKQKILRVFWPSSGMLVPQMSSIHCLSLMAHGIKHAAFIIRTAFYIHWNR